MLGPHLSTCVVLQAIKHQIGTSQVSSCMLIADHCQNVPFGRCSISLSFCDGTRMCILIMPMSHLPPFLLSPWLAPSLASLTARLPGLFPSSFLSSLCLDPPLCDTHQAVSTPGRPQPGTPVKPVVTTPAGREQTRTTSVTTPASSVSHTSVARSMAPPQNSLHQRAARPSRTGEASQTVIR